MATAENQRLYGMIVLHPYDDDVGEFFSHGVGVYYYHLPTLQINCH